MSLQKQLVHLNMTGGLQTKDDAFIVIPSKLAVADNVEFDDKSTVKARDGQAQQVLTTDSLSPEAVGTPRRLFVNKGSLFVESSTGVHGVHSAGARQIRQSSSDAYPRVFPRAGMTTQRLGAVLPKASIGGAGTPYYANNYDAATSTTATCAAFETLDASTDISTVRIVLSEFDGTPLADIQLNTLLSRARVKPRVIWTGTKFFVYYGAFTVAGSRFEIRRLGLSSTGAITDAEAVVVTSSISAGVVEESDYEVLFDLSIDGSTLGLVYRDINAAYTVYLLRLSATDGSTISDTANVNPSAMPTSLTCHAYISGSAVEIIHALFSTGVTTVRGIYRIVGTSTSAEAAVATGAALSVTGRIAAYTNADTTLTIAYDSDDATANRTTLRLSNVTQSHVVNSECPAYESAWRIAGRIGSVSSRLYLPMCYYSAETVAENTFFVIDLTSALRNLGSASNNTPFDVVARIDYGEGGVFRSEWRPESRVAGISVVSSTLYLPYLKFETDLVLVGVSNNVTSKALALAAIDFGSQIRDVEIGGDTLLAGACPRLFDGRVVVEEGFHHAPLVVTGSLSAVAGPTAYGPFPTGTCTFCFTLGWQDNSGNWHESAPSLEFSQTFAPGTLYLDPEVILPPTLKVGTVLRFWRTQASSTDTSLYLSTTPSGVFEGTDANLISGEQLYTTGGVLPNEPMPACRDLALFQNRIVATGLGDGSGITWSKVSQKGYGVEFCSSDPLHRTTAPVTLGRAVASREMDDRLFILCERGAGIIGGTGPAATGTQGQYSDFSTIVTETGCDWDSPKSVVRSPEGIWFRSPFGIRLISRSGGLARGQDGKQAGAEVDALVSGNVVAVHGPAKQQVRFYQAGNVLVWDYQWLQWTRFTNVVNTDAAFADERYYHVSELSGSSLLRYTDPDAETDIDATGASAALTGAVETPWLSFAGIQGFQRIYRLLILGSELVGGSKPVNFTLSVGYDFEPVTSVATVSSSPSNNRIQVQHHFAKQKCESMKLKIEFSCSNPALPSRFRLTDLTLQVGVKGTYNKMPSSQRF